MSNSNLENPGDAVKDNEKFKIYEIPEKYLPMSVKTFLLCEPPKSEFLIENLIPSAAITILSGYQSCGKSWLTLEILKSVGLGEPFLGKFISKKGKVLLVDLETGQSEIYRRLKKVIPEIPPEADILYNQDIKIDNKTDRQWLLQLAKERNYKLIIFDSFSEIHTKEENSARETQEIFNCLREFIKEDISILATHHLRKESFFGPKDPSQAVRGSSNILAKIDSLLSVENLRPGSQNLEIIIRQLKLREGQAAAPFKLALTEENNKIHFDYLGEVIEKERKLELAKKEIKEFLKSGEMSYRQIIEYLFSQYYAEATARRAILELRDQKVIRPRKEGIKKYYSLV